MRKKRSSVLTALAVGTLLFPAKVSAEVINDSLSLQEVVVTGTRNAIDVRHLPMTVTVVGRETLTKQHQPSVLPTVMQQVPGLFVTSRSMMGYGVSTGAAGGINLRGITGGAGQLLVLIDGHPQYNGVYGHPISDSYQTLMAERVEVLRGPASVLYGSNAMGGVLNIVTRSIHEDGVKTSVNLGAGSYGTMQAEASNQVRSGKFSSTVSAQYGRTDNHRPRMGFEQYGGYLKLGYDITEHWNAYVDADITHFNSSYPGAVSSPMYGADQWITRGVVSAAVENHYNRTSGALSVYSNFGRHKIDDGSADPTTPTQRFFRSKDALTGISWYQSAQLFEGNRLTVGMDYQHIYGHAYYTSKQTGEVLDTPNKQSGKSHRNEIAGYVDFRQDFASWLTIDAGLRLDHHSVTGTEWIPQVGIVVRPIETGEIKAMASKGFRNPTMREMYLYPPSNEELEPERIWNYELSWRHRLGAFHYGANLYYIKGDNMIQTVNRKNVNTGEIENYGAELEAEYRINSHWSVNTNHSLLHMEHPVIAAPTYKGFLGANYNCCRWTVVAGLQYISGLYTAVGDQEQKENFCLLNASVTYNVAKGLSLWLRGENLLAQSYEINLGYPMPRATFMGGINWNF
ncbi:iron complex outermembrane recepter protein [Segatella bryantii]|uniref:TonB-dependent receptor plug domain-containing protein n=1 Tax=Segatella bryantii TaxID=77095 RepID=UPI0008962D7B|nr:TonB-dependent receptor [Segatella bryantii]SEA09815.1 iron complex outermembrane recepter protein [Segatella bryantii]